MTFQDEEMANLQSGVEFDHNTIGYADLRGKTEVQGKSHKIH